MRDKNWITSHQARSRVEDAGIGLDALRIWAEEGLPTRALSMKRNGEPDTLPGGLDIPNDFWHWMTKDEDAVAEWGAGIFEVTVKNGIDDHPDFRERWQMSGVSFDGDELSRLIEVAIRGPTAQKTSDASRTSPERWQVQRVKEPQKLLFKFFQFGAAHLPGGDKELTKVALHSLYVAWARSEQPKLAPLKRTAFEKWFDRHQDGWRVAEGSWTLSQ